jgi:predicted transcriptional regulator
MRAARGLLDWTQGRLAEVSGVALSTIKRMESVGPDKSSVENIDKALARIGDAVALCIRNETGSQ